MLARGGGEELHVSIHVFIQRNPLNPGDGTMTQEHNILCEGAGGHVIGWATQTIMSMTSSNPRNYSGVPQRETI